MQYVIGFEPTFIYCYLFLTHFAFFALRADLYIVQALVLILVLLFWMEHVFSLDPYTSF